MAHFNLAEYQTVQERVDLFRVKHPTGRIEVDVVHSDENNIIVKASVYLNATDTLPTCVDLAHEVKDASPVNRTSWVENCSTSAVGRAISLLGGEFSPKGKRPSREEMAKVQRLTPTGPKAPTIDDIAAAGSLEELQMLWNVAKDAGVSTQLSGDFATRKKDLGG